MKKKPPTPKQREIALREQRDTALTNAWLRSIGVHANTMANWGTEYLTAYRIASDLLMNHRMLLSSEQLVTVTKFHNVMRYCGPTPLNTRMAIKVMNIGAAVNRKLFKQHRQLTKLITRQQ